MWSQLLYDESVCPGVVPEAFGSMVTLTTKGKSFSKVFHADYTKKKLIAAQMLCISPPVSPYLLFH